MTAIDPTASAVGTSVSRRALIKGGLGTLGAFGLGGVLSACGGSSLPSSGSGASGGAATSGAGDAPGPANATPSGSIRLLYQGAAADVATYNTLFDKYKKKYPGVTLEAIADPSTTWADFFTNVQVKLAGGQKFDVIYLPTEGQRLFASKGLIQPIDPWIKRDQTEIDEFKADADPTLVSDAAKLSSPDSNTYFLPYVFNTMCIWYRKSLLKAAGAATPSPTWTWDDFYKTAKAMSKPGQYGFSAGPQDFSGLEPWLLTNGASVLSPDWKTSTINSPAAIQSVTFAAKLVADGISPKPGGAYDEVAAFAKGQVAMIGNGRWAIADARSSKVVDDIGIVPWPTKTKQGSPVGWGSIGMLKSGGNKDTAWSFVKFLLTKDIQDFIAQTGFSSAVPARKSSATGSSMKLNSPEGTPYLYEALKYTTPVPGTDKSNLIEQAIANSYAQILGGTLSPAAGIAQLEAAIKPAL